MEIRPSLRQKKYNLIDRIKISAMEVDVEDIDDGISQLEGGGFWKWVYKINTVPLMPTDKHIKLLKLLKDYKLARLELYRRYLEKADKIMEE